METPSPVCPECGRLIRLDEALLAQASCVPCLECLLDQAEDAAFSGKLWAYEEEHADAA